MIIGERAEVVELAGARAGAALHLRETNMAFTLCGRDARGAQVLEKVKGIDFDPLDPDTRVCRTCWKLATFHPGTVTSR